MNTRAMTVALLGDQLIARSIDIRGLRKPALVDLLTKALISEHGEAFLNTNRSDYHWRNRPMKKSPTTSPFSSPFASPPGSRPSTPRPRHMSDDGHDSDETVGSSASAYTSIFGLW